MQNQTILITGANGEIGQNLISSLKSSSLNNKIIALDLNDNNNFPQIEFIQGSILDEQLIDKIFIHNKINIIFHLAAILSTKAELDPKLAEVVNLGGTQLLIKKSLESNCDIKFFFPSSIAVYNTINMMRDKRINEEMCLVNPLTIYGKTKLACEKKGLAVKSKKFDFRCIRFPGIISASTMPTGGTSDYAPEMIHHAAQKKSYNCFVHPDTKLPFVMMPDAINAILKIMRAPKNQLIQQVYNITSYSPCVKEFYVQTKKYYNNFHIDYKIDKMRQNIVNSWPDYIDDSKAKHDWGWDSSQDLSNAYKQYLIPTLRNYYKLGDKK
tara:strand:+ start:1696 stop:2670 length:975 start_codon:yes stop_codon:yes gene_type:complete